MSQLIPAYKKNIQSVFSTLGAHFTHTQKNLISS